MAAKRIEVWWGRQWIVPGQWRRGRKGAVEALVYSPVSRDFGWCAFGEMSWRPLTPERKRELDR